MDWSRQVGTAEQILDRICGEFLEMPGLRLTLAQAQRLWGLDADICRYLLDVLTAFKFLGRAEDGTYRRLSDGTVPTQSLLMAKTFVRA